MWLKDALFAISTKESIKNSKVNLLLYMLTSFTQDTSGTVWPISEEL